ncbi:MAG TPA: ROK family protein [Pirellulales bacterium]|nr:ROK family protein [Pirellulales bacterium]
MNLEQETCLIGIDVGGTKTAAGLVALPSGEVLARQRQPTSPVRGGEAILSDVIALARSLKDDARRLGLSPAGIGIGVAELVSPHGQVLSEATIRWRNIDVCRRVNRETSLPTTIDADVRAAARGEAELGAGRGLRSCLYITVGTGISACLVLEGSPYTGARGLAGTFASGRVLVPADHGDLVAGLPLEQFAGGPALASRLRARLPGFTGAAPDVLALAEAGNPAAIAVIESAGSALGASIAHLFNVLDPEAIVIGGGLGLAGGRYRMKLEEAFLDHVYSDSHRGIPLLASALGVDAGWIGAALFAAKHP